MALDHQATLDAAEEAVSAPPPRDPSEEAGHIYQIHGTWTGTITFEATIDGDNWFAIEATNVGDGVNSTTTSANGIFRIIGDGLQTRARMSAYTSGSAVVTPRTVVGG